MDIKYTISIEPECEVSPHDDFDDQCVAKEIEERLADGDDWAWCTVIVRAETEFDDISAYGETTLGCCSYKNEEDFKRESGLYEPMKEEALDDMKMKMKVAVEYGNKCAMILAELAAKEN